MTLFEKIMKSVHPDIDKSNFVMRMPSLVQNPINFARFKMSAETIGYKVRIGHLGDLHIFK